MKAFSIVVVLMCLGFGLAMRGDQTLDRAREMEKSGNAMEAHALLAQTVQNAPTDVTALTNYAEFLALHGSPEARDVYRRLLSVLQNSGDRVRQASVARRLVVLDLMAGDREAATRVLAAAGQSVPAAWHGSTGAKEEEHYIQIPGPLNSFRRMAAVSSEEDLDDFLPALARNVVTNGYQASHGNEALEQTEYLKLVNRYLSQARELEKLAGPDQVIKIDTCDSPKTGDLLRILGFRMRGGCGSELVLETVNATRAFLTTDSGFPIPELEHSLRTNRPFTYEYKPTRVPVLYGTNYWLTAKDREAGGFLDAFLADPAMCRLYLGLSKLDPETADALRRTVPMPKLKAYAHVMDFYGGMFEIRNSRALVPGGDRSAPVWAELAGVSPEQGAKFFERLLNKDDGWLASYYDALARLEGPVKDYLTEPARLNRFYLAIRGRVTSPGPARPVFRSNTDMLLLTTRLWLEPNGSPHIPGNLEVWSSLFSGRHHGKRYSELAKEAPNWKHPDDVIDALFALCRISVENEPLKVFMTLSDLDRNRPKPLEPATVQRLVNSFDWFGSQYVIFNDAPETSDQTIIQFLDTAEAVNKIGNKLLRSDTIGSMQALVGLWQIFSRQGSLPPTQADPALHKILAPFSQVQNDDELFDAGRNGVRTLLQATGSGPNASPEDRLVDLLAGASGPGDSDSHTQMAQQIIRVLEAQRMVSLNTLFDLADHLEDVSRGKSADTVLLNRLAGRLSDIQLPHASLSGMERNTLSFGYWIEKHIDQERKLNLRAEIDKNARNPEKLKAARGLLAPFLRDTLVALNYANYAPPGAQLLYTNPLFVRSHDFLGLQGSEHVWRHTEVFGTGWPSNGGGRLVGALTGLPYALAEAEQNFLVPAQTQALIWGDLVPQMILSSKVPRWWNVTPTQIHWVGVMLRYGHSLVAESAVDPALRRQVLKVLGEHAAPVRTWHIGRLLERGDAKTAIEEVTPTEFFLLAKVMSVHQKNQTGVFLTEIRRLEAAAPNQLSEEAISRAFGTPKPTLASSYRPELLHLRTFPTLMGYSSRIMAESWESNNIYWAALADEMYLQPSQLNLLIPEWTEQVVERIFASHLDDWPALLRSLRDVGSTVRAKAKPPVIEEQKASLQ